MRRSGYAVPHGPRDACRPDLGPAAVPFPTSVVSTGVETVLSARSSHFRGHDPAPLDPSVLRVCIQSRERAAARDFRCHDVSQNHRRIPLQPRQLRPLHRRLPERRDERVLIQRQDVSRQRHRILPGDEPSRGKRRILSQRLRKLHVPRTHALGDVSVYPFCDSTDDGRANTRAWAQLAAVRRLPARWRRWMTRRASARCRSVLPP